MKRILCLILAFLSLSAHAGRGMIVVLEAPFFRERSWDSQVVQNVRKGDIIFIHNQHMGVSTYEVDYGVERELEGLRDKEGEGFYQTLDNNGLPAYIPKKYVKLIYKDTREFRTKVSPFERDPTDYRLEEPLPQNYPLFPTDKRRASIYLGFGPGVKNNYSYSRPLTRETFSSRKGFEVFYTRKVEFDPYDRFYFGGMFHLYGESAEFILNDGTEASESKGQIGAGPLATYDVFRTKKDIFTVGGGLTLNYNRYLVDQARGDLAEERIFQGFSITPKLMAFYQRKDVLMKNLNVILGAQMQLHLAHALGSSPSTGNNNFWNEDTEDRFVIPTGGQYSVFFGIQTTTE